jgi:hypothetical protein
VGTICLPFQVGKPQRRIPVLTKHQIDYFRAFGFVALPGLLGPERTDALRAEVDVALRDAYAATYDERVIDGISGHYLPMASRLTPTSASLVCDDPVLMDTAEELLGVPVLPSLPEGVLYFAEAGWHDDDGTGVQGSNSLPISITSTPAAGRCASSRALSTTTDAPSSGRTSTPPTTISPA